LSDQGTARVGDDWLSVFCETDHLVHAGLSPLDRVCLSADGSVGLWVHRYGYGIMRWNTEAGRFRVEREDTSRLLLAADVSRDGTKILLVWPNALTVLDTARGRTLEQFDVGEVDDFSLMPFAFDNACAFSADGMQALCAMADQTVWLWDLVRGERFGILECHEDKVQDVCFSEDGTLALTAGGEDMTVRLWDLASVTCILKLEGHTGTVSSARFDSACRVVVSADAAGELRVWELPTGRCLHVLKGHGPAVTSLALTADGAFALSGNIYGSLHIWDVRAGECVRAFRSHIGPVKSVAMDANGRVALSGGQDGTLRMWPIAELRHLPAALPAAGGTVPLCSEGSDQVSSAQVRSERIALSAIAAGRHLKRLICVDNRVSAVALSADGRLLAAGMDDGRVRLLDSVGRTPVDILESRPTPVTALKLNVASRLLLAAHADESLCVLSLLTGALQKTFHAAGEICCCGMSAAGELILSHAVGQRPRIWDVRTGACLRSLGGTDVEPVNSCLTADGRQALISFRDGSLSVWNTADGTCTAKYPGAPVDPGAIDIAADGNHAVAGTPEGTVVVWETATGKWGVLCVGHHCCFPGLLPEEHSSMKVRSPIAFAGLRMAPLHVLVYDAVGTGYHWRADLRDFSLLSPIGDERPPDHICLSADGRTVIEFVRRK
jgi:WD40 repeat protein